MALRDVLAIFQVQVQGAGKIKDVNAELRAASLEAKKLEAALRFDIKSAQLDALKGKLDSIRNPIKEMAGGTDTNDSGAGLAKILRGLQDFGQALTGGFIIEGIKNFVAGQMDMALTLDRTSRILGVSTDRLQQFHLAAQESNTEIGAVDSALRFLNRTIGSLGTKGIGAKGAKELVGLGINLKDAAGKSRPVVDVFVDLADKLKAVGDQGKATEIAMQVLGRGGARSLPMLLQGGDVLRKQFADLARLGGGIAPEFIKGARELQVEEVRLKTVGEGLLSRLANGFIPGLKRTAVMFTDLGIKVLDVNKHLTAFDSLPVFTTLAGIVVGIASVTKAWGILQGLLGVSNPVILGIVASATALYGIFDDIFALFQGDESVIGDVLDQMYGKGGSTAFVDSLKASWDRVRDAIFGSSAAGESFGQTMAKHVLPTLEKGVVHIIELLQSLTDTLISTPKLLQDVAMLAQTTDKPAWERLKGDYMKLGNRIAETLHLPGTGAAAQDDQRKAFDAAAAAPGVMQIGQQTIAGSQRPDAGATAIPPVVINAHFYGDHPSPKKIASDLDPVVQRALKNHAATQSRNAMGAVGGL